MKYLLTTGVTLFVLQFVCYAMTGCTDDAQTTTLIKDARFTVTCLPTVMTPAGCDNITPIMIRDVKTGAEYLVICTTHDGITMMKLDPAPAAEKAP